jgi:hypothetical protein
MTVDLASEKTAHSAAGSAVRLLGKSQKVHNNVSLVAGRADSGEGRNSMLTGL